MKKQSTPGLSGFTGNSGFARDVRICKLYAKGKRSALPPTANTALRRAR